MPSVTITQRPTRLAVFEPLVAIAKARAVFLGEQGALDEEDVEFLLRALIDLESDGVDLFGRDLPADDAFYAAVVDYLVARVGPVAAAAPLLAPATAETIARLGAEEGERVAQLIGLPQNTPPTRALDRAVLQLITHQGGRA
jgi:hypothetical protein